MMNALEQMWKESRFRTDTLVVRDLRSQKTKQPRLTRWPDGHFK